MEYSMTTQLFIELLGTLILVLFGNGVYACVMLNKSKGQNSGWIVTTIVWGLAVRMGVLVAGPYIGAHFNPAVSTGLATAGTSPWSSVPIYAAGQMIGDVLDVILVWIFYKDHYDTTDNGAVKFGTFCTAPTIRNYKLNSFYEIIATLVLVFIIISFSSKGNCCDPKGFKFGLTALGPIPVTLPIIILRMSLGGSTGYAMNPTRNLPPRIAHALCMKGNSGQAYAWVPILGPIVGGVIAGLCGAAPHQL